jgi:hypothetical protein
MFSGGYSFVDIGGIVDHQCLEVVIRLFITTNINKRIATSKQ